MTSAPHYTLFCARNSYAMIVHAMLEEVGADYDVRWVELFSESPDPDFQAASPHLRVPALTGPDGALFETGAIALYLAERHPQAGLVIPPGDPRRGKFLQWIHYLASTLQPDVMIQYHPEFYFDGADDRQRLRKASMIRLARVLEVIDDALDPGPYFFGDQLTVCDFCLAMQAVWPVIYPGSIADYPNIERHVAVVTGRASAAKVLIMNEETWAGAPGRRPTKEDPTPG